MNLPALQKSTPLPDLQVRMRLFEGNLPFQRGKGVRTIRWAGAGSHFQVRLPVCPPPLSVQVSVVVSIYELFPSLSMYSQHLPEGVGRT